MPVSWPIDLWNYSRSWRFRLRSLIEAVRNFDRAWTQSYVLGSAGHRKRKSGRVHRAAALPICNLRKTGIGGARRSFGRASTLGQGVAGAHIAFRFSIFVL